MCTNKVTVSVFHDGQFFVALFERYDDNGYAVCRATFPMEPSNPQLLAFIHANYDRLPFSQPNSDVKREKGISKNPKRRQREAAKASQQPTLSTKAQQALSQQHEELKVASKKRRSEKRRETEQRKYELKCEKKKEKKRGH